MNALEIKEALREWCVKGNLIVVGVIGQKIVEAKTKTSVPMQICRVGEFKTFMEDEGYQRNQSVENEFTYISLYIAARGILCLNVNLRD